MDSFVRRVQVKSPDALFYHRYLVLGEDHGHDHAKAVHVTAAGVVPLVVARMPGLRNGAR
jgi:hypothetical protein